MQTGNVQVPFLVLRFPTLPLSVFGRISTDGGEAADIDALIALIGDWPQLEEALYVASPDLHAAWLQAKTQAPLAGRARRKLFLTLQKYLIRATTRATPYGLFAGCATVPLSKISYQPGPSQATVEPTCGSVAHRRFDSSYLARVAYELHSEPALWPFLRFWSNSSLYRAGSGWRYTEYAYEDEKRSYRLVRLDDSALLSAVVQASLSGSSYESLLHLHQVYALDKEIVADFLAELIRSQVLLSDLLPNVTGDAFQRVFFTKITFVCSQLPPTGLRHQLMQLIEADKTLTDINTGATNPMVGYRRVVAQLTEAGFPVLPAQLIHTDLTHQVRHLSLDTGLIDQLYEAISVLSYVSAGQRPAVLADFETRFVERYESRSVPLAEALDPEIGIPFGRPTNNRQPNAVDTSRKTALLMSLYRRALRQRLTVVSIDTPDNLPADLHLGENDLGQSFGVLVNLIQVSGESGLLFRGAGGPSATNMLSRFSLADSTLATELQRLVDTEQQLAGGGLLADLSHLPDDRAGNVVMRRTARTYEIPYGVHSLRGPEGLIRLDELLLRYQHGQLQLWSNRLQQVIVPLLSTAYNFAQETMLPVFQFLSYYQYAVTQSKPAYWDWDFLRKEPFLPRIQYKQVVLSPATWNLPVADLQRAITDNQRVTELQAAYHLPRYVTIAEGDNVLTLDLQQRFSLDLMLEQARGQSVVTVQEAFFNEQNAWVTDQEGNCYAAEMVIPFLKPADPSASKTPASLAALPKLTQPTKHFPGSEWLYFKIYAGASVCDNILLYQIAPLCEGWTDKGKIRCWFFLRYADPDHHLRLRVKMASPRMVGTFIRALHRALMPSIEASLISRIGLDTYLPEEERYSVGPYALTEALFEASSRVVLSILALAVAADSASDELVRQIGALMLIDAWLTVAGLLTDEKIGLAQTVCNQLLTELDETEREAIKGALSYQYRQQKVLLQQALLHMPTVDFPHITQLADYCTAFITAISPIQAALNKVGWSVTDQQLFMANHVHMFVNRLFPQHQRVEELRLYELYRRSVQAVAAQHKRSPPRSE